MKLFILFLCLISSKVWADPTTANTINNLVSLSTNAILAKSVQDIGFGLYLQGTTISFAGQTVIQGSSSNPQSDMVSYHQQSFCSKNITAEKTGLSCQASFGNDSSAMELGDIKAGSLLMPVIYDQYMDIAAQQFIRNLVQPFPANTWNMALENSSNVITNGDNIKRQAYATALAQQALYNVARYSLNNSYATRLATESFNDYNTAVSSSSQSTLSIMQNEATKWYDQVDFTQTAAGQNFATEAAFLQAMAQMQSFQLWMGFQQYKQLERIETLLAAMLSNSVTNSPTAAAKK